MFWSFTVWLFAAAACTGIPTDTGAPPASESGTGTTGVLVGSTCERPLDAYCADGTCPTFADQLAAVALCDTADTGATFDPSGFYSCCTIVSCDDPTLGQLDGLSCPGGLESASWWFDASTGALVSHRRSTDYSCCCDEQAVAESFGPQPDCG